MLRKGKLCFILLFLVLFYWPNLALSHTDLYPIDSIKRIKDLVLERRGDKADVYFPNVHAAEDAFPVVAVLQGAFVDKKFYSKFGTQLARFGFVVVIPNHLPFTDQHVVNEVLDQMKLEDADPTSPLFGIVDTTLIDIAGHSFGGAVGLFAIEGSCNPPFCFGFFQRPQELRAGAFYGTNSVDPITGELIDVDTDDFPVALVQGSRDGISTPEEAKATFNILDGVRALIPIDGANHYGITNVNFSDSLPPPAAPARA